MRVDRNGTWPPPWLVFSSSAALMKVRAGVRVRGSRLLLTPAPISQDVMAPEGVRWELRGCVGSLGDHMTTCSCRGFCLFALSDVSLLSKVSVFALEDVETFLPGLLVEGLF